MIFKLGSGSVSGVGLGSASINKNYKFNSITDIKFVDGFYILHQRDNYSFAVTAGYLKVSSNNSDTFPTSTAFANTVNVCDAYIHPNGNISFFTLDNKIYLTDVNLSHVTEKFMYDTDGETLMTFHEAVNPTYDGWYFHQYGHAFKDSDNVHVFGNYANIYESGACPIHIYYSADFGVKYQICYKFGQNMRRRDDGTGWGGTTGTILGDSGNSIVTDHIHQIKYNSYNDKWYCVTGDSLSYAHWFEGVYNSGEDSWVWSQITFDISPDNNRLESPGMIFIDDYIYWGGEQNPAVNNEENGFWRSKMSTFTDSTTHKQLLAINDDVGSILNGLLYDEDTGILIGSLNNSWVEDGKRDRLIMVKDTGGFEFSVYRDVTLDFLIGAEKNNDGYYLFSTEGYDTEQAKSLLIKIGDNLLNNQ